MAKLMVFIGFTVLALVFSSVVVNAQWGDEVPDSSGNQIGVGFEAFSPVNPEASSTDSQAITPESRVAEGFISEGSIEGVVSWEDLPATVFENTQGSYRVNFIDGGSVSILAPSDTTEIDWDGGRFEGPTSQLGNVAVDGITFYGAEETIEDTATINIGEDITWQRGSGQGDYTDNHYRLNIPGTHIWYASTDGKDTAVKGDSINGISFSQRAPDGTKLLIDTNSKSEIAEKGVIRTIGVDGGMLVAIQGLTGKNSISVAHTEYGSPKVEVNDHMSDNVGGFRKIAFDDGNGISITQYEGNKYTLDGQNGLKKSGYDEGGKEAVYNFEMNFNTEIKEALKADNPTLKYNGDGSLDITYSKEDVEHSVHIPARLSELANPHKVPGI